jgi:hypothetical protein
MKNNIQILIFTFLIFIMYQFGCNVYNKNINLNYEILSTDEEIIIPFEIYRNDIRMKATVNDKECYVLLDNGSLWDELLFFGSPKVDSLGLNLTGKTYIGDSTTTNPIIADIDTSVNIAFQNIVFRKQKAIITRYIPGLPNLWEGANLQISAAFFKNFVVEINFDKRYIKLIHPEKFNYTGKGQELKMKEGPYNSRLITADITQLNGKKISIDLLVDLGGVHPLYLPIGKRDDIILPNNVIESILGSGLQGPVIGYIGRVKELKLGSYKIDNVLTAFSEVDKSTDEYGNTMLGIKLLQQFNITFDYFNERIFLLPSKDFNKHVSFNMTGLELLPNPDGSLGVIRVYPDSPAERAGIVQGDIITHINNIQIKELTSNEIRTILMQEGQTVILTVKSNGQYKEISIKLREII